MWWVQPLIVGLLLGIHPRTGLLKNSPGRYFAGLLWREIVSVTLMLLYSYFFTPAFVGALQGIELPVIVIGLLNLIVSWAEDSADRESAEPVFGSVVGVCYGLFVLFVWTSGASCFQADTYAKMIGGGKKVEEVDYKPSISPTDPRHLRAISHSHAVALMMSTMNQPVPDLPNRTLGSQFQIDKSNLTIQRIRGKLFNAAPLAFRSWGTWKNLPYVPGFVYIDAEDPMAMPQLVTELDGKPIQIRYAPSAYWGFDLQRHLWLQGFRNVRLEDYSFEIDDTLHPWWVVTILKPKLLNTADAVEGVVVVDPQTGSWHEYKLGQIPDWIDRVFPADLVRRWVEDWGSLRFGWSNANAPVGSSQISVYKPVGDTVEVFGDNEDIMWHTALTTNNENDDTLVGFVHVDTRTGQAKFYRMTHGATHVNKLWQTAESALKNAGKLGGHVADALPAKIYGRWTLTFICDDASDRFLCFVIVDVENPSIHAIGETRGEVLRNMKEMLARSSDNDPASESHELFKVGKGKVLRVATITQDRKSIIELVVDTMPGKILRGEIQKKTVELPFVRIGDSVEFEYNEVQGERDVMLMSIDVVEILNSPTSALPSSGSTPATTGPQAPSKQGVAPTTTTGNQGR